MSGKTDSGVMHHSYFQHPLNTLYTFYFNLTAWKYRQYGTVWL